ncbi:TetR/AcrR family transcriptional regulator [Desulfotomaculum copahuensis]|uniref:TetR family transcriptional regulator n=1 Tax=Desulfotomaculum copahuensis TaxID=1838280 RepID=A0A1B7LDZ1_9FIRM|nr:TetR/AcrR family transcriptional regulator [Desulfotomaculum copahuensis]OAT81310.1 TetR family transcriptional regulator [Desulfotomaculum copahuensis]
MSEGNKQEKRQKILACALVLFTEKGYLHTTVREIIDQSGFGTSTFYRHFSNKEDVLKTLLSDFLEQIINRVNDYFTQEKNLYLRLVETKRVIIEVFAENKELAEIYSRVPGISESIDHVLSEFDARFLDFTIKNIEYGIKKGIFRKLEVVPIAHAILGIIKYAVYKWVVLKEISIEEVSHMVTSFQESLAVGLMQEST